LARFKFSWLNENGFWLGTDADFLEKKCAPCFQQVPIAKSIMRHPLDERDQIFLLDAAHDIPLFLVFLSQIQAFSERRLNGSASDNQTYVRQIPASHAGAHSCRPTCARSRRFF
jgi:hypothetical protein